MTRAATALPAAVLVACVALLAAAATAHVPLRRTTLREWIATSAATAYVEVESGPRTVRLPATEDRQDAFALRILEVLRGPALPDRLEIASHAEGLPGWAPGDHAIVFLQPAADHAELGAAGAYFRFVSVQGAGQEWRIADPERALPVLRAIAAGSAGDAAGTRALLEAQFDSRDEVLAADALVELMALGTQPSALALLLPDTDAIARLELAAAGLSIARRAALVGLLSELPAYDASRGWNALASAAVQPAARAALAQAIGARPGAPLGDWLAAQLEQPDPATRRAAAASLAMRAAPGSDSLLAALASSDPDPGVAREAIRGLGHLATPLAIDTLSTLAGLGGERGRWARAAERRGRAGP